MLRRDETPIEAVPPSSRRAAQAFPAARPLAASGVFSDWDEMAPPADLSDTLTDNAGVQVPQEVPPSGRTFVGPVGVRDTMLAPGPTTERKLRTLDPGEGSVEATRVGLFAVPAAQPVEESPRRVELPPSYRTRVGPYFIPRDPATEPVLELADPAPGAAPPRRIVRRRRGAWRRFWRFLRRLLPRA